MVDSFNRANLKQIEYKMQAAMERIAAEFGFQVDVGSIRFNSNTFKVSIEGKTAAMVEVETKAEKISNPGMLNVGSQFVVKRTTYTVTAIHPNRPKNCYTVSTNNGTTWRCGQEFVEGGSIIKRA